MAENTSCCTGSSVAEVPPTEKTFKPRVDIVETDAELLLYADLPGALPYDIDLNFEQGELTLRAKVKPRSTKDRDVFSEYEVGDFYRAFQVSELIDSSKIDAEFKNGVLTVHLPKQQAAQPQRVPIRVQA
jgi:HSP20 family molecular chaperone IbpA